MREFRCLGCGHAFPWPPALGKPRCPRCGSGRLWANPWLFGTDTPVDPEDYLSGYFEP